MARYNADLANNFGNLANRVLNMAVNYCGGVVPDTRADGPLVAAAARPRSTRCTARLDGARLLERLRRGVGAHPRHEPLHRGTAAVGAQQGGRHRRGRGGARRLPRGAADRRAARVAGDPARVAPSSGAGSGSPAPPRTSASPTRPAWGRPPRRRAPGEGRRRCSPRIETVAATHERARLTWVDSHCHLQWRGTEADADTAVQRGPGGRGRGDGVRRHRPGVVPRRRSSSPTATPTCARPSASTRTTRRGSTTSGTTLAALARRSRASSRSARPASTSTTSTPPRRRAGGRVPRPDRARARRSTARS